MELTLIQKIAVWILPLLFAITLHEVAHGFVANLFGDKTAKLSGRLTINPIKHIDPIGTIIVPMVLLVIGGFIFGWAKPIPVNARNVSRPRIEMPLISLAGPLSNLLMAFFWAGIAKAGYLLIGDNPWFGSPMIYMGQAGVLINIVLAILNCLPIPPLDGWHAILYLVSGRVSYHLARFEQYGFFILVLLLITGAFSYLIELPVFAIIQWMSVLFGINLMPS